MALQFDYGTTNPDSLTSLRVRLAYRPADGSDGKAPTLQSLVVRAPTGARFVVGDRPVCTADDLTLRLLGRDACPAMSRLGAGTFAADTGLGAPLDPFSADLVAFATPKGLVELVQLPGTNITLGMDRLDVDGESLTAHPPATPGGPPDGRTAVRDIDLLLDPQGGYARTPPTCPPGGWQASATAGFPDGTSETATDVVACAQRALALRVTPRRTRAGRATTFRFSTALPDGTPAAGAQLTFAGRRLRADAAGRAAIRLRFRRPGLVRAVGRHERLTFAVARVRVVPAD